MKLSEAKKKLGGTNGMDSTDVEEVLPSVKDDGTSSESPSQQNSAEDKPTVDSANIPTSKDQDEKDLFDPNLKKASLTYNRDLSLLNQWFKLDENAVPSVYRIQPIR